MTFKTFQILKCYFRDISNPETFALYSIHIENVRTEFLSRNTYRFLCQRSSIILPQRGLNTRTNFNPTHSVRAQHLAISSEYLSPFQQLVYFQTMTGFSRTVGRFDGSDSHQVGKLSPRICLQVVPASKADS